MFLRRNKINTFKKGRKVGDIAVDRRPRVLNLKRMRRFYIASLILVGLIALIAVGWLFYAHRIKAEKAKFYPTSCLGGWQNPYLAQGKPDLDEDAPPGAFNDINSAVLKNSISQIYCGGFEGEIPPDAEPQKAFVRFSWAIKLPGDEIPFNQSTSSLPSEDSTQDINHATSVPESMNESTTTPELNAPNNNSGQKDLQKNKEEVESSEKPISFGQKIIRAVFAQEVSPPKENLLPAETASNVPVQETPPNNARGPSPEVLSAETSDTGQMESPTTTTEEISSISTSTSTTTPTEEATTTPASTPKPFLEVLFTTDGTNWQLIDKVNHDNWRNLELEIPNFNWNNLSKIQISLRSPQTVDTVFTIYLDSLWLEVEYQSLSVNINKLSKEEIDPTKIFKSPKTDFRADEEPEFEINTTIDEKEIKNQLPNEIKSATSSPSSLFNFLRQLVNLKKVFAKTAKNKILKAEVINPEGNKTEIQPIIKESQGKFSILIPKPNYSFQPGKYRLRIEILSGDRIFISSQDFTWGVLAINTNKSVFLPDEQVYLQMAALKDDGHTLCDANLALTIISPNNETANPAIQKSDDCGPNNVTDKPDYFAYYQTNETGVYQMKLTNLDNGYEITDSFEVRDEVPFDVERIGPTRIYPPVSYEMKIRIKADQDFNGEIIEYVPGSFEITAHEATQIRTQKNTKEIIWQADWKTGETYELTYQFDAMDISPYLYLLGPLSFVDKTLSATNTNNHKEISGTSSNISGKLVFKELRSWQIAADAVASLILLWDDGVLDAPTGWTCISCNGGQDFNLKFIRGNSSYGSPSGSLTHTHGSPTVTDGGATANTGSLSEPGGSLSYPGTHNDHTASVNSGLGGSNVPTYRYLKVIQYDNGIPDTLPAGVIAIFDGTRPGGWTDVYNDGRYIYGYDTANVTGTGGANTHSHTLGLSSPSGATSASTGTTKTGTGPLVADLNHTHTITNAGVTGNASPDNEPPYMTVILAKKNSAGPIDAGVIGMFNNTPPAANWTVNSGSGQAFYQRMFKPTGAYGTSRDISAHTHTGTTIASGYPSPTIQLKNTGTGFTSSTHTHTFTVGALNSQSHLPPYIDVIFAKAGSSPAPALQQIHYHWRNDNGDESETGATSATSGVEDTPYTTFPSSGHKRIRIEISNEGGAATSSVSFRLEYGVKSTTCGAISNWYQVGVGSDWSMYDSTYIPIDGGDTTNIAVSTGGVTDYNPTFKTPNSALKDTSSQVTAMALTYEDFAEIEFSINPNVSSGDYCFRVTDSGSTVNFTYYESTYAQATVIFATVSCTSEPDSVDFLTLTTSQIHTTTDNATTTMSCSYAGGCTLYIKDNNAGLYKTVAPNDLINSTTETLLEGTEGYGVQGNTTSTALTIDSVYDKSGSDVGGLQTGDQTYASSASPFDYHDVVTIHKATLDPLNYYGDYSDTIYYSCLGN